jgi:hypothetical protein
VLGHGATSTERRERAEFARANYSWTVSGARYVDIVLRMCGPRVAPPGR